MQQLSKKLSFSLFMLLLSNFLFCQEASFLIPDTPVLVSNFTSSTMQKGKPYFMLNWYEGIESDGQYFALSNWPPYTPKFTLAYEDLEIKDTYNRVKQLNDTNLFTGIVLYLDLQDINHISILKKLMANFNFQYFLRTYSMSGNNIIPLQKIEGEILKIAKDPRLDWYLNDDVQNETWNIETAGNASRILRSLFPEKKQLSACMIRDYYKSHSYLVQLADIIAPQIYPLTKNLKAYVDLFSATPVNSTLQVFHFEILKGKQLVNNQNQKNAHKVYYCLTQSNYHANTPLNDYTSRFPDKNELRFMFYDSIIGGVKGLDFFCFYRSSKESFENIIEVTKEFRDTGFQDAVLNGKYNPEFLNTSKMKINTDLDSYYGKNFWDIDYTLYEYKNTYYVILANNSQNPVSVELEVKIKSKYRWSEIRSSGKKIDSTLINDNANSVKLVFTPFETKLLKISKGNNK